MLAIYMLSEIQVSHGALRGTLGRGDQLQPGNCPAGSSATLPGFGAIFHVHGIVVVKGAGEELMFFFGDCNWVRGRIVALYMFTSHCGISAAVTR